ncbi:hypothetical protein F2Y05_01850 [Alistipes onderdonkii]|nr:hypothetical protein F2Y05_01850 [Alistipes onderdonkii]KAA2389691.1 hypothetical protein F2Y03_05680 [Alistipes onderdonkii]KAA2405839.1 hypothetical protein F2X95_02670 [Alistipes onderdonkii]KAA2408202.1 hypothetical protein F2X93_01930 [Alistipes onderdonkii]KAA2417186.1 hypothetical protein F2X98_02760 [Alistipes onderdonkii]
MQYTRHRGRGQRLPAQIFPSLAGVCLRQTVESQSDTTMPQRTCKNFWRKGKYYYIVFTKKKIKKSNRRMKQTQKYARRAVLGLSIALFILYFVLTSVPEFDTEENKIYFKIFYIVPFVLLVIYSILKNETK